MENHLIDAVLEIWGKHTFNRNLLIHNKVKISRMEKVRSYLLKTAITADLAFASTLGCATYKYFPSAYCVSYKICHWVLPRG